MNRKFREKLILFVAKIVARPFLLLYQQTLSIKRYNHQAVRTCRQKREPILFATWHENMILTLLSNAHQGIHVLVSQHFDGEIIATILKVFGYQAIRGSSTRGGQKAYSEMKSLIKRGRFELAFTPDGPKGPRRRVKMGIVRLASETDSPIIPVAIAGSREFRLKSWDRLLIILPFSKCTVIYGEPLKIPGGLNTAKLSEYSDLLTQRMNRLEEEAVECLP